MSGLLWKLNRLRAMGAAEVLYRLRHASQAHWEQRGFGLARSGEPVEKYGQVWSTELSCEFDVAASRLTADRVLNGRFHVFALNDVEIGFPPQWNRDPLTGTTAPLTFGKTLNYRDESLVGNIKYLWESNRHLELVTLSQAYHLTKDQKYAFACRTLLQSWFEQCPYPLGPNWTSSLELAVRLLNWAFSWQLLGGSDSILFKEKEGKAFKTQWLTSIFQHCHFISGHFSLHSSANNHLMGEYMGLFVGSTIWPCWQESGKWQRVAYKGLEEEARKQNFPDGANREQGIWYHHEVADMLLLCGLTGRANGREFSPRYWRVLETMLEYVASMMDVAGNVAMIGDSDDAVMVRFVPDHSFPVFRSLLATGAVLFSRSDFASKAWAFDDKSRWLLGDEGVSAFNALLREAGDGTPVFRRIFSDAGYYILGKDFETEREVKLIVDAGPLGYLSIAAHGHADALAFVLSVAGREILIDPGTFTYNSPRMWRDYFKGTGAHNTVRVDGEDQSVSGGNFLWLKHAQAWCALWESGEDRDVFVGCHDGYRRLKDPVRHRRTLILDKANRKLHVTDRLECVGHHRVELLFHTSEACLVENVNGIIRVENGPVKVILRNMAPGWQVAVVIGQYSPPLGWVSRRFDERKPTHTIVWTGEIHGTTELLTELEIEIDQDFKLKQ